MAGRVLVGVDSTKAAELVRQRAEEKRREAWPYLHVYPPPNADTVHQIAFVANPGAGNSADVLTYQVPGGMRFFLRAILQAYGVGADFSPGDAVWNVTVNKASGLSSVQAMPVQGLTNLSIPLGSLSAGTQWPFVDPYEFSELDVIRSTVRDVNLVGGSFVSGFFGYLVPGV